MVKVWLANLRDVCHIIATSCPSVSPRNTYRCTNGWINNSIDPPSDTYKSGIDPIKFRDSWAQERQRAESEAKGAQEVSIRARVTTPVGNCRRQRKKMNLCSKLLYSTWGWVLKFIIHAIIVREFLSHSQISTMWCSSAATQRPLVQFPFWIELVWVLWLVGSIRIGLWDSDQTGKTWNAFWCWSLEETIKYHGYIIIIEPLVVQVAKLNEEMAEKSAQWEKDRVCRLHAVQPCSTGKV